jgi:hypothetical protein
MALLEDVIATLITLDSNEGHIDDVGLGHWIPSTLQTTRRTVERGRWGSLIWERLMGWVKMSVYLSKNRKIRKTIEVAQKFYYNS